MNIFSVVMLVCSISTGQCIQIAPKGVVNSQAMCEAGVAYAEKTFDEKNEDKDVFMVARCLKWGKES